METKPRSPLCCNLFLAGSDADCSWESPEELGKAPRQIAGVGADPVSWPFDGRGGKAGKAVSLTLKLSHTGLIPKQRGMSWCPLPVPQKPGQVKRAGLGEKVQVHLEGRWLSLMPSGNLGRSSVESDFLDVHWDSCSLECQSYKQANAIVSLLLQLKHTSVWGRAQS